MLNWIKEKWHLGLIYVYFLFTRKNSLVLWHYPQDFWKNNGINLFLIKTYSTACYTRKSISSIIVRSIIDEIVIVVWTQYEKRVLLRQWDKKNKNKKNLRISCVIRILSSSGIIIKKTLEPLGQLTKNRL